MRSALAWYAAAWASIMMMLWLSHTGLTITSRLFLRGIIVAGDVGADGGGHAGQPRAET